MQFIHWGLSFKTLKRTHTHTHKHTCAPGAHRPLCGCGHVHYGHIEEILPSQFPGTELGVTWLADTQPQWKECNSTPPSSIQQSAGPAV